MKNVKTWAGLIVATTMWTVNMPAAMAQPFAPEPLRGLSADQLGRVAESLVSREGAIIAPRTAITDSNERDMTPVAKATSAARPAGVIDDRVLASEIRSWFVPFDNCRIEVARDRRLPAASVAAQVITLRWMIAESGQVTGAQVVATMPTDPAVLLCVKRQTNTWMFTPPAGGPLPVERVFWFRPFASVQPVETVEAIESVEPAARD